MKQPKFKRGDKVVAVDGLNNVITRGVIRTNAVLENGKYYYQFSGPHPYGDAKAVEDQLRKSDE